MSTKLSICIATYNRSAFIGATLDSILHQTQDACEVLILDGGSTDSTEQVVSAYLHRFNRLRYIRQDTNNGVDRDYDRAVELATGEYCWLMTDDDLLKPGSVATVLSALNDDPSLVLANLELMDMGMSMVLQERWLKHTSNCSYGPEEMDRLFEDVGAALKYIGCVIIKRSIWLTRERQLYYGSLFIHLGVIFQERLPGDTRVIADPLIRYRCYNTQTWSPKAFETFMFGWPSLVWSLAPSESAKQKVCNQEPWRDLQDLLRRRAMAQYSLAEYQQWIRSRLHTPLQALPYLLIAVFPGALVNAMLMIYLSMFRGRCPQGATRKLVLHGLRHSRFHFRNALASPASRQ